MGSPSSGTDVPSYDDLVNLHGQTFKRLIVEKGMSPAQAADELGNRSMAVRQFLMQGFDMIED